MTNGGILHSVFAVSDFRLIGRRNEIICILCEDQSAQAPDAAVKMAAHQVFDAVDASHIDQAQHLLMVLKNILNVAALNNIQRTKARIAGLRAAHLLPEEKIVCCPEPDFVHGQIDFQENVNRKTLGISEIDLSDFLQTGIGKAHALDICRRTGQDKITQDHTFHGDTLINQLIDDVVVELGDNAALAGKNLNETVFLQALKHTAHRCARNGKTLAQVMLAERVAGLVIKAQDFIRKRLINPIMITDCMNCHKLFVLKQ